MSLLLIYLIVGGFVLAAVCAMADVGLSVTGLRCEGVREPSQVEDANPRFSWRLSAAGSDVRQAACQLRIVEVDSNGAALGPAFESAKLETDQCQWVSAPGFSAKPRAAYAWQVRVWDNHANVSDWSESQRFGTGLRGAKWPADWISDGRTVELHQTAPARYFRGNFKLERIPVRARLYVSAMGLVDPWLNGKKVTEDQFIPGWPEYRRRLFYAAYDVTPHLRVGDNVLGMILGDGWYSGTMIPRHQFGQQAMVSAFIDLTDSNGQVTTIGTGSGWQWTDDGPITMQSIYDGETYDARRELRGYTDPSAASATATWRPVSVTPGQRPPLAMTGRLSPPVRRLDRIQPISVKSPTPGIHIYDLGQNITGWARLRV